MMKTKKLKKIIRSLNNFSHASKIPKRKFHKQLQGGVLGKVYNKRNRYDLLNLIPRHQFSSFRMLNSKSS